MIELPILYKKTTLGQVQQWQIIVENDTFYTIEGINTLTTSKPTICFPKNTGKANETTAEEQALLEAKSKWQKKIDKGYSEDPDGGEAEFFEPMLAFERSKYEKLLFTVPTFMQPKLDGVRCILKNGKLTTRNGKDIVSCPHLELPNMFLDGELYNHNLKHDFNKIISLTRKTKPTAEDIKEAAESVQYWVYDNPGYQGTFSERFSELGFSTYPDSIKLVPTYQVSSLDDIDKLHLRFIREGYEGSIIRLDLGEYENKRSKQLLKYKDFIDDEFIILDVIEGEGNRSGMAGKLICKIGNNTFGCSMTGNQDFMTKVLEDKDQIIGKLATVKYFALTPDGIPRFPVLKHIHNYEIR